MAKNTLESWDTTAANNTDVGGNNVTGTGLVSTADDSFREIMSQAAKWLGSDTLASATTADLGSVNGRYVAITGTTTITGFGTIKAGTVKYLKFADILTLTHNATSLILPTGASITTAAGDTAIVVSEGSGNWRCLAYQRASGAALAGSSAASTTEVLTGTDTAKAVTPDALAALWEKGSDVASASTVSLGEGGIFHITGTTTITDIDFSTPKDGRTATLIFDGALTLTHNATTLVLPGGANISTAAGDRCMVVQDSSDNIIVTNYTKADGTSVVAPAAGQPIPTSSTFAVGTLLLCKYNSTTALANGATTAGSNLQSVVAGSSGTLGPPGGAGVQTGTWRNDSGSTLDLDGGAFVYGYFTRVS